MNKKPATSLISLLICLTSIYSNAQTGSQLFDPTYLHEVRLCFFEDNFFEMMNQDWINNRKFLGSDKSYTKALLEIDGFLLDTSGVRIKGNSSYTYTTDKKKPFKIDLNEFVKGQSYDGMKKFNLHSGACDPSMLRDFLANDI